MRRCKVCRTVLWPIRDGGYACIRCDRVDLWPAVVTAKPAPYDWATDPDSGL